MDPLLMASERTFGFKGFRTSWLATLMGRQALVVFQDMLVERLSLAEALSTVTASETIGAFVDSLMSLQASSCDEALTAAFSLADMLALVRMYGLDVLLEMLVFNVVLVTVVIWAFKRP